ncbi:RES domain-containing protein [Rhodococcus sp. HNM0569]|uniref:RES domain-containing protein n=1 Tax=Rhodococcus sp. HNM0569 TaxID=2716340 RepID=UPI00146B3912|nr:RES domain-containing protein [Rhodococcus sp. HNM0569]NLU85104.1 RES domain-containing protein [Rhodococcus sp. HNM0569]
MNAPSQALIPTPRGDVCCVYLRGAAAYRVGYPPNSWEWTPWEFATDGRFTGRWDDPGGVWRTLYVGATRLSCYLEVLAYARKSEELSAALDEIAADDDGAYPTIAPGRIPRSWMSNRVTGSGAISGWFVVPGAAESVATLRITFRHKAIRHGLFDLDTAAIRDGRPRALTQAISRWTNTLTDPDGEPVAGIQFESRHGDGLVLWALYERPGDGPISKNVVVLDYGPVERHDPDLIEAMRLHNLIWADD